MKAATKHLSKNILYHIFIAVAMVATTACNDILDDSTHGDGGSISLSADINQQAVRRVNDSGFSDGDMMGVYVVDYEGANPGTLKPNGNRGNNVGSVEK